MSNFIPEIWKTQIEKQLKNDMIFIDHIIFHDDVTAALLYATLTGKHCPQLLKEIDLNPSPFITFKVKES